MRKVGLLGGTFNPPHIGHLLMANEVRYALGLDEVRLMPTSIPSHKMAPEDASAQQRLQMVKLAVSNLQGITVSPIEVERGGISYTYDTITQLKKIEPDVAFYFIIGGDMIDMLSDWHRIDELLSLITFVGVGRPGAHGVTDYPVIMVEVPQIDLSSTFIRNRLAEKGSVQIMLPPKVEAYVREEGLYGC